MKYVMLDPRVPGRPIGALMPQPAILPTASSGGLMHVFGQPGTMGIPAPKPGAIPPTACGTRTNQPSYVSPDVMFPSIYYPKADNCHGPVGLFRDNQMPVPARRIYNMPRVAQRMRRVGGQSQIGQPAVAQTWPQWTRGR
jgi:hypothetical protein